jgi:hypothetical protein
MFKSPSLVAGNNVDPIFDWWQRRFHPSFVASVVIVSTSFDACGVSLCKILHRWLLKSGLYRRWSQAAKPVTEKEGSFVGRAPSSVPAASSASAVDGVPAGAGPGRASAAGARIRLGSLSLSLLSSCLRDRGRRFRSAGWREGGMRRPLRRRSAASSQPRR